MGKRESCATGLSGSPKSLAHPGNPLVLTVQGACGSHELLQEKAMEILLCNLLSELGVGKLLASLPVFVDFYWSIAKMTLVLNSGPTS